MFVVIRSHWDNWFDLICSCKALVRRAILASNIAIKRYRDKTILWQSDNFFDKSNIFWQNIAVAFLNQLKIPWIKIFNSHDEEKNIIFLHIALSFYRNIACKNCSSDEGLRVCWELRPKLCKISELISSKLLLTNFLMWSLVYYLKLALKPNQ